MSPGPAVIPQNQKNSLIFKGFPTNFLAKAGVLW